MESINGCWFERFSNTRNIWMPLLEFTLIQHANLSKHIVKETEQYAQEHYTEYGWWFWETMSTKLAYGHSVVADFECYKVRWMLKGSLGGATINSLEIWSTNMCCSCICTSNWLWGMSLESCCYGWLCSTSVYIICFGCILFHWFWETKSTNRIYGHFVVTDFGCDRAHWLLNWSLGGATIKFWRYGVRLCVVLAYAHQSDYEECR